MIATQKLQPKVLSQPENLMLSHIFDASASFDRRSEDVLVMPVIVAELELRDVQVQILSADLVEASDDAALDQRPEAFDCIGVDCADNAMPNVMAITVIDGFVREAVLPAETMVASEIVSAEQTNLRRNGFFDEAFKRADLNVRDDAGYDVAFSLYRTNNDGLVASAAPLGVLSLVLMPIGVLAADIGFIDLNNTAKLLYIFDQCGSDLMAHQPSGFVGTKAHDSLYLECRNPLLTGQHHVNHAIPIAERLVRVLEDFAGYVRKSGAVLRSTFVALPMPRAIGELVGLLFPAAWTFEAIAPTAVPPDV